MIHMDDRIVIPVLFGPTASGKTQLALSLAEFQHPVRIISADSRQVFRRLDIGTAKPSADERQILPHSCIDLVEPDDDYSAGRWIADASEAIDAALQSGQLPILVGGTGFYLKALFDGLGAPALDVSLRTELDEAWQLDPEALRMELKAVDPDAAGAIDPNNRERVIRAVGCFRQTGKTYSSYRTGQSRFASRYFVLNPPRDELGARIRNRTEHMIENGLVAEVEALLADGYDPSLQSLRTVGYREVIDVLEGRRREEELVDAISAATSRYAKRQRTWIRHQLPSGAQVVQRPDITEFLAWIQAIDS